MKSLIPFLSLMLVLASCTTAYKTGQTPDDVYFSPQRQQDEYVRVDNKKNQYRYDEQNEDDRYLRMKVRNRRTWSDLDFYYNDPFAYNYYSYNRYNNFYYNNPWNYYNSWNYYYNPYSYYNPYYSHYNSYGPRVIVVNPKAPVYNRPRQFNLNVYDSPNNNNRTYNGRNNRTFGGGYQPTNAPRRNSGNNLRERFGNNSSSSDSRPTYNAPTRTESSNSNNSSNNSSNSGSKSGGNAPVRKF